MTLMSDIYTQVLQLYWLEGGEVISSNACQGLLDEYPLPSLRITGNPEHTFVHGLNVMVQISTFLSLGHNNVANGGSRVRPDLDVMHLFFPVFVFLSGFLIFEYVLNVFTFLLYMLI